MSLFSIDKTNPDRSAPTPNTNDGVINRMAHDTLSTVYAAPGEISNGPRVQMSNDTIIIQDSDSENSVVINKDGITGYSESVGITFKLPSDGSSPIFNNGVVGQTIYNIDSASVIKTSETALDGSDASAGVLIDNTGFYGAAANQDMTNANVRILATGDAYFAGEIVAGSGQIGGWDIGTDALTSSSGTVGMSSAITAGDDIRFWAGNATPSSAPFYVTESGKLTATDATISGSISATTGSIGGWSVGATSLTSGATTTTVGLDSGGTNPAIYAGSATPASAPFRVTNTGDLTSTSATITGAITANTGYIGGTSGWTISSKTITGVSDSKIVSGLLESSDWGTLAGSQIDLNNKTMKFGGSSAPKFSVAADGTLTATGASIGGAITAGTIDIGGADTTSFHVDVDGNMWSGDATFAAAPFKVSNAGALTATSGNVGNWDIDATKVYKDGATDATSAGLAPADYPFYAGKKYADRATAPFRVTPAGVLTATSGIIGGTTIGASTLTGGTIQTAASGNRVVMDSSGITGTDTVLGTTFTLPTDGSAPTFSSGIINKTTYNIDTSSVLRTSATALDGSASSAGVLINNTGFYAGGANQDTTDANVRIKSDGTASFSGDLIATTVNPSDSITLKEGGVINITSVTAPTACTAALISDSTAGQVDNGEHKYKITFVNSGGETELGDVSNTVTVDSTHTSVSLTSIPISSSSGVSYRKIYRTKAGGSSYYLLHTILNNINTTYTDKTTDASLDADDATNRVNTTQGGLTVAGYRTTMFNETTTSLGQLSGGAYMSGSGFCTFVGSRAGETTTTGTLNTMVGSSAGASNTTGGNNTMIGTVAGQSNTVGGSNTIVGAYAGRLITGSTNTILGCSALNGSTTGSGNVVLGFSAGMHETGSNSFYVDNQDRTDTAGDKAKALLYGTFNSTASNQTLKTNSVFSTTYGLKTDTISEITPAAGVTIDGVLIKDGLVDGVDVSTAATTSTKLDDFATPDNNTDLNANTTNHGLLLQATAPAAGLTNVVAIENGETVYKNKALYDATSPTTQAFGDAATTGSATVAARRDHKHAMMSAPTTVSGSAGSLKSPATTGLATLTGMGTGQTRNYTVPDADATILYSGGDLGTPSSGVATNLTGTASGLTAGHVTTNANLTGDVTSSGNATTLSTSAIYLGYAAITSPFTSTTTGSYADVTGLSITVTVPSGGRNVKITVGGRIMYSTAAAGTTVELVVYDNTAGAIIGGISLNSPGASYSMNPNFVAFHTPSSGSRTYKIQFKTSAAGTFGLRGTDSTTPAFILVELC